MSRRTVKLASLAAPEKYSFIGGPFGSKLTSVDYVEDGIPVIRGSNLNGGRYLDETEFVFVSEQKMREDLFGNLAHRGDVVFTQRGTLGQTALIPHDARFDTYVISQSQMKLTVDPEKADPRFVYYYFSSHEAIQKIRNQNSSSGVPHINLTSLRNFLVPLVPLDEQKRIADTLSAYDDLIANNRRRIELLEKAARLIYDEWFGRLRFPGYTHIEIVDGVPEGWERRTFVELAKVVMGQSPRSQFYNKTGDGLPFHQGVTDYGFRFVSHRIYSTAVTKLADAGDILVSVRAPVGRINVTRDRIVLGRGLASLRSRTGHQSFLFYALKSHFYAEDIIGTGAIYAATNKKELEGQILLKPPPSLLWQFEDQARAIDSQIACLTSQNGKLAEARDLLLPRLMNAEIPV